MSVKHLADLRAALIQKGWRIVRQHDGDNDRVSASWEIRRSTRQPAMFIDFDGFDDMQCLPVEESYACTIRSTRAASLYFGKRTAKWRRELEAFVDKLDMASRGC